MADMFARRIYRLDTSKPPVCLHCDRILSPHGDNLACPCCGEIYMYEAKYVDSEVPNQNGWVHTNLESSPRNPAVYTVIGKHSCRMGTRREDAKFVYYRNAEGKMVRRRKTPAELKIDREVRYSQGSLDLAIGEV